LLDGRTGNDQLSGGLNNDTLLAARVTISSRPATATIWSMWHRQRQKDRQQRATTLTFSAARVTITNEGTGDFSELSKGG
jgi:Ca2+-binding RTX toxin-like protein